MFKSRMEWRKWQLMVPLAAGERTWHTAFNIARYVVWSAGRGNIRGGNSIRSYLTLQFKWRPEVFIEHIPST